MEGQYVVIGAGGHAKVAVDILQRNGKKIAGVVDKKGETGTSFLGLPILGDDGILPQLYQQKIHKAAMGIGHTGDAKVRGQIYHMMCKMGFAFPNLIHPDTSLSGRIRYGEGNLFGPRCSVNPDAVIGDLCIINTGAIIEHEVVIGNGVHIAPHAAVLGGAVIGEDTFVGAGSIILQGIHIGRNCIIGAGSVILHDVDDFCVMVGNPGKLLKRRPF